MMTEFMGEFMGTMTLILLGGGVNAATSLEKSYAKGSGWIVVTAGWAFAVACGIFVAKALGGSGALNPVGPISNIVLGKETWEANLVQVAAEFCGAFVGAVLVWIQYWPHWKETKDAATKRGVFCTSPAIRNTPANFMSEFIGTFALVLIATSIGEALEGTMQAPLIGMVVWAVGLSLGGSTGYAINPARDFSPRLAHALLPIEGKGGSDWGYAWLPVVGPISGAIVASLVFRALQ
jgi:glycerol uptake facilitator protein